MKIELKAIKINLTFSEETTMFQANLYIDGKKVGYCQNDGRGGPTYYNADKKEYRVLIEEAEEYCKNLPKVKYSLGEYSQSLESVIDDIVEKEVEKKEVKKFTSTIKRLEKQSLIITKDPVDNIRQYSTVKFNQPIHKMVSTPAGKTFVTNTLEKYKTEGYTVLNTNLTF